MSGAMNGLGDILPCPDLEVDIPIVHKYKHYLE